MTWPDKYCSTLGLFSNDFWVIFSNTTLGVAGSRLTKDVSNGLNHQTGFVVCSFLAVCLLNEHAMELCF